MMSGDSSTVMRSALAPSSATKRAPWQQSRRGTNTPCHWVNHTWHAASLFTKDSEVGDNKQGTPNLAAEGFKKYIHLWEQDACEMSSGTVKQSPACPLQCKQVTQTDALRLALRRHSLRNLRYMDQAHQRHQHATLPSLSADLASLVQPFGAPPPGVNDVIHTPPPVHPEAPPFPPFLLPFWHTYMHKT